MRTEHQAPRRVLAYARVSSVGQEQHGTSLAGQKTEMLRFCKASDYPEPELFVEVESGGEGREENRTEQVRLMASLRAGDLVLCCKQDRWSRDTLHYLDSTRKITAKGARFFSIAERFDPSTPEGELAATMMAAIARQELARIKERTVGTRRVLRAAGAFVEGTPPPGYVVKNRKLYIDPTGAEVVRRMYAMCVEGRSVREIATTIAEDFPGTRGLDWTGVARRIRDRRYIGESNTIGAKGRAPKGDWIVTHEPIVDAATWRKAQAAMEVRKVRGRPPTGEGRNRDFLLRGIAVCGHCDHVLVAHSPTPGTSVHHGGYYLCRFRAAQPLRKVPRCPGPCAKHVDVDAQAEAEMLARLEALTELLARPPRAVVAAPAFDFDGERAKVLRRRTNLVNAIAEGVLTTDVAREKMGAIDRALDALEERREKATRAALTAPDRAALLSTVRQVRDGWKWMKPDRKRAALARFAERIEVTSTAAKKWQRGAWKLTITWKETQ